MFLNEETIRKEARYFVSKLNKIYLALISAKKNGPKYIVIMKINVKPNSFRKWK